MLLIGLALFYNQWDITAINYRGADEKPYRHMYCTVKKIEVSTNKLEYYVEDKGNTQGISSSNMDRHTIMYIPIAYICQDPTG